MGRKGLMGLPAVAFKGDTLWLSVGEASSHSGYTPQQVYNLIRRRVVRARRFKNSLLLVSRRDLDEYTGRADWPGEAVWKQNT